MIILPEKYWLDGYIKHSIYDRYYYDHNGKCIYDDLKNIPCKIISGEPHIIRFEHNNITNYEIGKFLINQRLDHHRKDHIEFICDTKSLYEIDRFISHYRVKKDYIINPKKYSIETTEEIISWNIPDGFIEIEDQHFTFDTMKELKLLFP